MTFDDNLISDLHKDVYGYRPSVDYMEDWNQLTDTEKQEEWDRLVKYLGEALEEEKRAQRIAMVEFKREMNLAESYGAKTELDQIKWVISSQLSVNDLRYGFGAVCYHFGLAYQNEYVDLIDQSCKELVDEHHRSQDG